MKRSSLFLSLCGLSYFLIVFFNSFVDLGHKIIIQNIFYDTSSPHDFTIWSTLLNAIFLIPYIFMFSPSGFMADRFSKVTVMRVTAFAAVPMTLLVTYCYYHGYFWPAFWMVLVLAVQSTFNSPAKYGYVKEYFHKELISKANAVVQSVAMVAILLGTFAFSLLYAHYTDSLAHKQLDNTLLALAPSGWLLVAGSVLEAILTLFLKPFPAAAPESRFEIPKYATGQYLWRNMKFVTLNRTIFYCVIALAIFWGVNQVVIANYGAYLKEVTHASAVFVQGAFAVAIIGILFGASFAAKVSKRFIESGSIPFAILALAIMLWILVAVESKHMILGLFLLYGFFSGMLVVPLNALIQFNAPENALGKVLAGNNFLQFILMLVFLGLSLVFTLFNFNIVTIVHLLALACLIGAILALKLLPQSFIRFVLWLVFSRFYRLNVQGLNNLPSAGGVLLLGNHTSYLDWAIIQIASPRPVRFVMDRSIYENKLLHWLLKACRVIPISRGGSKTAIAAIHEALKNGDVVALFPEGYLSRNGQMGEFYKGYEMAIADTDAVIVPFYIHGLWGSFASHSSQRYRKISKTRALREVTFAFGAVLPKQTQAAVLKQAVIELSSQVWHNIIQPRDTLARSWLKRTKQQGSQTALIDDLSGIKLSGYRLIASVFCFRRQLRALVKGQETVGILLPNSMGGVLANLACLCLGKKLVNINYTASPQAVEHMIQAAGIKTVLTSEQFLKKLAAKGVQLPILSQVNSVNLEDLKANISKLGFVFYSLLARLLPTGMLRVLFVKAGRANDTATILFSSGSEGLPKGVELTHKNILSNIKQVSCVLCIQDSDVVLSCLPLFHAFGLVVTTLMPLVEGTVIVCTPDPTDAAKVAKAIATYEATILCGTSTFLNLYARNKRVHPLMLQSLRLVIAGAEKLSDSVKQAFHEKFLLEIYEGYGATETSPVASFNLPDVLVKEDWHVQVTNKPGTVGMPLPGTSFKIVDPTSKVSLPIGEAGMILISGPQVMKAYLNQPEKTAQALLELEGKTWYVTGDKGHLDADGYLTIVDRYSRFAKIAGEMVSLGAVEHGIQTVLPEGAQCLAVNIPDEKKGEQIVLLITQVEVETAESLIKDSGLNPLMQPNKIIKVAELPKLGSGKPDYAQAKKLALE